VYVLARVACGDDARPWLAAARRRRNRMQNGIGARDRIGRIVPGRLHEIVSKLLIWQLELAAWLVETGADVERDDGALELASWRPDDSRGCRETAHHGERMAGYATRLGRLVGLTEDEITTLRLGALLHDVGKHAIPEDLLLKSAPLSREEYEIVKQHTLIGDALCASIPALDRIRPIVRHHHERLNGTGYPSGLVGAEVPLLAQIVGIVDVYDALVHARAYKPALDTGTACAILAGEAKKGWRRRDLVWAFIELVEQDHRPGDVARAS
jgi:hypothetical protein